MLNEIKCTLFIYEWRCYFHFTTPLLLLQWNEVSDQLNVAGQKPVVLNRTSTTNTTNPFGSTYCYGVQDMIFEVGLLA